MVQNRRDFFSSLASQLDSDFGLPTASTGDQTTTTASVESTSDSSTNSAQATSTVTSVVSSTRKSTNSASISTTSVDSSPITSSSSSSISSSSQTSSSALSSPTSVTSTTSSPADPVALPTSMSSPASSEDGNHISTLGISVAAVFAVLILASVAYLLWKYLPAAKRYRERKYHERSHRKGFSFDDEEGMHLDDPKQGLALRKFSFDTAATYYPGQAHEREDISKRPLTSVSEDHVVSPMSTRSMGSISQHTLPSALQPGPTNYLPYRDMRASEIGVAVPIRSPSLHDKGLPPLPSNRNGSPLP